MMYFNQLATAMITALLFSMSVPGVQAQMTTGLTEGNSQEVGLSANHLANIDALCQEYLEKDWLPGGTILIARHGKIAYFKNWGYRDKTTKTPYEKDDIFRIASMTKGITTTAVLQLLEQGKFRLDDPVWWYLPEFKDPKVLETFNEKDTTYTTQPAERQISIRHLLTHTAGIAYTFSDPRLAAVYTKNKAAGFGLSHPTATTEEMVKALAAQPLAHHPGEKYTYGHSTDVLGYLVEVVSGQTLGAYCRDHILDPLQMEDTYFYLPEDRADRLVPVYYEDRATGIHLHDQTPFLYPLSGRDDHFAGGGGLSSTTEDYAVFCQMLLNKGVYNGQRILGRKTVDLIQTDQLAFMGIPPSNPRSGSSFGLGFSIQTSDARALGSVGTYGWGGAFNTKYWIDPQEDIVFVGMTQMLPTLHGEFWDKLYAIIYAALEDEPSQSATSQGIVGSWNYLVKNTPEGNLKGTMIISKDGASYKGVMESFGQKTALKDIKLVGDKLSFTLDYGGTLVSVNGTVNTDKFIGKVAVEGQEFPIEATR